MPLDKVIWYINQYGFPLIALLYVVFRLDTMVAKLIDFNNRQAIFLQRIMDKLNVKNGPMTP